MFQRNIQPGTRRPTLWRSFGPEHAQPEVYIIGLAIAKRLVPSSRLHSGSAKEKCGLRRSPADHRRRMTDLPVA